MLSSSAQGPGLSSHTYDTVLSGNGYNLYNVALPQWSPDSGKLAAVKITAGVTSQYGFFLSNCNNNTTYSLTLGQEDDISGTGISGTFAKKMSRFIRNYTLHTGDTQTVAPFSFLANHASTDSLTSNLTSFVGTGKVDYSYLCFTYTTLNADVNVPVYGYNSNINNTIHFSVTYLFTAPTKAATPPADTTKPATPPADTTKPATPPADTTKPATPPADSTQKPAPPVQTPPADTTQKPATPAPAPTPTPAPPADSAQTPAPSAPALPPAKLTGFTAELELPHVAELNWSAVNDSTDRTYDIQRSSDGKTFTTIYTVRVDKNGQSADYNYTDDLPDSMSGYIYYRLQIHDQDALALSGMQQVTVQGSGFLTTRDAAGATTGGFRIYPNPATSYIDVNTGTEPGDWQVDILATNGTVVQRAVILQQNILHIPFTTRLAVGTYFVRLTERHGQHVQSGSFVVIGN